MTSVLRDSDLSIDENNLLQYTKILSDRFGTIEEFSATDENELVNLGITNQLDRVHLIKQARLLDDKEDLPLARQSTLSSRSLGNWLVNNQSTPLNPKSKCNLSPALVSRISFNDHHPYDESINGNKTCHSETPNKSLIIEKSNSSKKQTPQTSTPGLRTIRSLSDTILLQKKIIVGTDRLKRLAITRSIFKRQTTVLTKKISNLTNKFINPFVKIKNTNVPILDENEENSTMENSSKPIQENQERRKIQVLSLNNDIRRSTDLLYQQDQEKFKPTVQPAQILATKRFKLGATTAFLTRTLANHNQIE